MIVAFDASALVKLLISEEGIDVVDALWDGASRRTASTLAYAETTAALSAARRAHRLTTAHWRIAVHQFDMRWRELDPVAVDWQIARRAGELIHDGLPLSGADAVHLATAIEVSDEGAVLATWDKRLSKAARAAGLAVAP